MSCRICLESDNAYDFVQPCNCKGTSANVHSKCIKKWIKQSGDTHCKVCTGEYDIEVAPQKDIIREICLCVLLVSALIFLTDDKGGSFVVVIIVLVYVWMMICCKCICTIFVNRITTDNDENENENDNEETY